MNSNVQEDKNEFVVELRNTQNHEVEVIKTRKINSPSNSNSSNNSKKKKRAKKRKEKKKSKRKKNKRRSLFSTIANSLFGKNKKRRNRKKSKRSF